MLKRTWLWALALLLAACFIGEAQAGGREYYKRGFETQNAGDHARAVDYFTKGIASGALSRKQRGIAYAKRAFSYYELGQYDQAVADCNKSLGYDPNYSEAYVVRADTYYKKGDYQSAISDYTTALSYSPDDTTLLYNRGATYLDMGERERARADFQRACDLGEEEGCKVIEQMDEQDRQAEEQKQQKPAQ